VVFRKHEKGYEYTAQKKQRAHADKEEAREWLYRWVLPLAITTVVFVGIALVGNYSHSIMYRAVINSPVYVILAFLIFFYYCRRKCIGMPLFAPGWGSGFRGIAVSNFIIVLVLITVVIYNESALRETGTSAVYWLDDLNSGFWHAVWGGNKPYERKHKSIYTPITTPENERSWKMTNSQYVPVKKGDKWLVEWRKAGQPRSDLIEVKKCPVPIILYTESLRGTLTIIIITKKNIWGHQHKQNIQKN
jgi:hypothetical protein